MAARKPRLLRALNELYQGAGEGAGTIDNVVDFAMTATERGPAVPWLSGPEDSWL
jgi:hypothetical protein